MLDRAAILRWGALIGTAVVLQFGFVSYLRILGVAPDLCLLLACAAGVVAGPRRGGYIGFAVGLCFDSVLSGPLGISALAFTIVGYSAGFVHDGTIARSTPIDLAIIGGSSAVGQLIYAVLAALFGQPVLGDPKLWRVPIIVGVVAVVLAPAALRLCRWAEGDTAPALGR